MAKTATIRSAKTPSSVQSGQYIGRTQEGLLIPKPPFKPKNFTVRELQQAIRDVRDAAAGVGGEAALRRAREDALTVNRTR